MVEIDTNVKDFTNRINFGIIVCTSGTRPTAVDGKTIYETDTDKLLIYNGASWAEITGGGAGDFMADGSVPMTGDLTFNMVDPEIIFDTGDYLQYDKTDNYLHVVIGSAVIASFKNDRIIHNYINYHNANIDMNTYKIVDLGAHTTNGDAIRFEHIALDEHTQYYNSARHTKAIHDALNIDADTLDGLNSLSFVKADGTVSMTDDLDFNTTDAAVWFDTNDSIWIDSSEDRLYFEIASDNICYIRSTGLHPDNTDTYYLGSGSSYWKGLYATDLVVEAGTYISGDGAGNMELHVATGKTVKIVVG